MRTLHPRDRNYLGWGKAVKEEQRILLQVNQPLGDLGTGERDIEVE